MKAGVCKEGEPVWGLSPELLSWGAWLLEYPWTNTAVAKTILFEFVLCFYGDYLLERDTDAIFSGAGQWVMVVRLDRWLNFGVKLSAGILFSLARLGCTERSVRLARTTITSTPRSVNDVEVRSISNLKGDYCQ